MMPDDSQSKISETNQFQLGLVQGPRVIVAMDFDNTSQALQLAKSLDPNLCRLKVGNELFTQAGPSVVHDFQNLGFDVFLDLKFHDIPNTVAGAVRSAARMGVWMVNVHASGGQQMLEAARQALEAFSKPPLLIGVSVLTSLSDAALAQVGWQQGAEKTVSQLAALAWSAKLDGLVCSAWEAAMLRQQLMQVDPKRQPVLVTPGIRPAQSSQDDQTRIMTPAEAIRQGSSYLVVGRPITAVKNPTESLRKITEEIASC